MRPFLLPLVSALIGCGYNPPGFAGLLHDTRLAVAQADYASLIVAVGEYCEGRPFEAYRTRIVHMRATASPATQNAFGSDRFDSVEPTINRVKGDTISVEVENERIPPTDFEAAMHRYPEACKSITASDATLIIERGAYQARGPSGKWYAVTPETLKKLLAAFAGKEQQQDVPTVEQPAGPVE